MHQATVLTWDILRCQGVKVGVLRSHQRPALESLLRKIQVRTASKKGISEAVAQSEAHELGAPWFKDPASRPAMMKMIEMAGYPPDAIEVEAFQLALPALATIERLIVSAQKRLDRYLEDLERTSKADPRALRLAAEKAIAENDARRVGVAEVSPMASQRQIAANKRNGPKSRGPCSQEGKTRSRMNALRHGLAAVSINTTTATADDPAFPDDSWVDAMYQRLRQIDVERVKVLNEVHNLSRSEDLDTLHTVVRRHAALERYSQRSHSKPKKYLF